MDSGRIDSIEQRTPRPEYQCSKQLRKCAVCDMVAALKERHASPHSVKAEAAEAMMRFNAGSQLTSPTILQELNITLAYYAVEKGRC